MQKYQDVVLDSQGDAISGVTLTVKNYPADTLATIYSDNGVTLIASSQVTSDANGKYAFYAANGRYNLNFLKTGFVSTTLTDVMVQDFTTVSSGGLGAGTVGAPALTFGGDTTTGMYRPAANQIGVTVSGSNLATFSATGLSINGVISISIGAAVGGATAQAGGIAFPAAQTVVADANTLDDYEEGTWTPSITRSSSAPTGLTYQFQAGTYTKIGRMVTATCVVVPNAISTQGSGIWQVTGLPFSPLFSTVTRFNGSVGVDLCLGGTHNTCTLSVATGSAVNMTLNGTNDTTSTLTAGAANTLSFTISYEG